MSDQFHKFLGDTPSRTLVKLVVLSIVIGFVMTILDVNAFDLLRHVRQFILDLWYQGYQALGQFGQYLLLGATVVVPVFLILRLINYRR